jgi:16S rRNA C1402 N4-methylase RsmH
MGTCDVCGECKPVTETRDYGYLAKGINELKNQKPIMTDEELEELIEEFAPRVK